MLSRFFKFCVCIACCVFIAACSSTAKKTPIVIDKTAESSAPVLSASDQKSYSDALVMIRNGDHEAATTILLGLVEVYPRLAGAFVNLGLIAEAQKESERALGYYQQALDINPNNIAALIQVAKTQQNQGEFVKAEASLRRAHAVDGSNTIVNYNLGMLYELYLQDTDLAIEHYGAYVKFSKADDVKIVERWIKLLERK